MSDPVNQKHIQALDPVTFAIYLKAPPAKVVLLQALFENYEGVATIRTLDIKKSLLSVLCTASMLPDTLKILEALKPLVAWEPQVEDLAEETRN